MTTKKQTKKLLKNVFPRITNVDYSGRERTFYICNFPYSGSEVYRLGVLVGSENIKQRIKLVN